LWLQLITFHRSSSNSRSRPLLLVTQKWPCEHTHMHCRAWLQACCSLQQCCGVFQMFVLDGCWASPQPDVVVIRVRAKPPPLPSTTP
jgi:hypothetical protein